MKKVIATIISITLILIICLTCTACTDNATTKDVNATYEIGIALANNQPTPTDIEYSLERYNLIKRAYWVNGMRAKAFSLPSPIAEMPIGYVVLFTESGAVVGSFTIEGKVTSLNSYLTPDSDYYEGCSGSSNYRNRWMPDVDGSYGENDNGIFFFTTDGKYVEWSGTYFYSDIPVSVNSMVLGY